MNFLSRFRWAAGLLAAGMVVVVACIGGAAEPRKAMRGPSTVRRDPDTARDPFCGPVKVKSVRRSKKDVVRVDLDTGKIAPILTLLPGDDADVVGGQGLGWSTKNTLIIGLVEHSAAADCLEVDVQKKTQRRFSPVSLYKMWDSDEALANVAYFPRGGNHGDTSGSGKWFFLYHGMHKPGESLWAHGKGARGAWWNEARPSLCPTENISFSTTGAPAGW